MILVTGATGNVGGALVRQLVATGVPVRALTRDPDRAILPAGVEAVAGDLAEPESLDRALTGVDALFLLCRGNESGIVAAAERAGVSRVTLLSTVATESRPASAIGHGHLLAERAVLSSGLAWTLLRPGGFATNTLGWAPMVRDGRVFAPFASVGLPLIHPDDIASVAVATFTEAGHDGRIHHLTGPALVTPVDQVRAIGSALGRELDFVEITREEARQALLAHMPAVYAEATLDLTGAPTPEEVVVRNTVEEIVGKPARTYQQWAAENVRYFR